MNKSVKDSVRHIGRLALGIFSVASAYRLMSSASSTLGQYDEQYATNLEYIRYLIAQAIAPALKYVVNLASTLLSYLNYIVQAWTGISLFSKNSAKNFVNAKNSTSGISKNTGKIKSDLQTTSFDEMNVLADTSSTGTSGTSGGGAIAPSIDPSVLAGEVPEWLKWIVDNKDLIFSVFAGVTAGLLAWKMGLDEIKSLGIGILIAGVVQLIQDFIKYLKDPSWENFGKIIKDIGLIVVGFGLTIGNLPLAVAGAGIIIVGLIAQYWEQIKGFFQQGIDWLRGKTDWIKENFGIVGEFIYTIFVNTLQNVLNIFDSIFTTIKGIFDGLIQFIKGVFTGNWKQAWEGVKKIFESLFVGIANFFSSIMGIITGKVYNIGKTTGEIISNVFKAVVNSVLKTIESVLNSPIKTINSLIGVINAVPGINLGTLPTFNLPRLKVGGIINMPGRGIPVGGGTAIGGEAGREGVIPLTDSQAMETLGEAIGRYITINANITNTMNGRVISRQLQQINNENNFAYNR